MGDQQHGLALPVEPLEQFHDLLAAVGVERPGWFVGEEEDGLVDQGRAIATRCCWPPDRWAGYWSARLGDVELGQQLHAPGSCRGGSGAQQLGGEEDVLEHGQVAEQVEELEDEPQSRAPEAGQAGFAEPAQVLPCHPAPGHRSAGRPRRPG